MSYWDKLSPHSCINSTTSYNKRTDSWESWTLNPVFLRAWMIYGKKYVWLQAQFGSFWRRTFSHPWIKVLGLGETQVNSRFYSMNCSKKRRCKFYQTSLTFLSPCYLHTYKVVTRARSQKLKRRIDSYTNYNVNVHTGWPITLIPIFCCNQFGEFPRLEGRYRSYLLPK